MTKVPNLEKSEQLELQNIMLRMALEQERLAKYDRMASESQRTYAVCQTQLSEWNKKYSKEKLEPMGLDITRVGIDADTGEVSILRQEAP